MTPPKDGSFTHYWWEFKMVQPLWKMVQQLLIKFSTDLSHYSVISLWGILFSKEWTTWVNLQSIKLSKWSQSQKWTYWSSLVVQWLRICLPMQWTRVWSLVQKDPSCCGATKPASHSYLCSTAREATAMRGSYATAKRSPCSLQLEKAPGQQQRPRTAKKINKEEEISPNSQWLRMWLYLVTRSLKK